MSGTAAVAGRLSESTRERIKEYILSHRLRAGDALPAEGSLARELGISRTSVREAVKALESVGILETRPGVGLFVRPFSFDPIVANLGYSLLFDHHTLAELLAVRTQLEAGFIETAAAEVTPDQLRVLRSLVDRMGERAALSDGPGDFKEEDRAFHRTLYIGLGNQLLLKMLDVFWTVYRRLRDQAHVEAIDNVRTWENHRGIVEALERRDGPGARQAMLEHFGGIRARIHSALDDVVQQRPGRTGGAGGRGAAGDGERAGAGGGASA